MYYIYFQFSEHKFGHFLHEDHCFYCISDPCRPEKLEFRTFNEISEYISKDTLPAGKYFIIDEDMVKVGNFLRIDLNQAIDELIAI